MLHVTQGHEKGIGLEVFFKSLLLINSNDCEKITLHASKDQVQKALELIDKNLFEVSSSKISFNNKYINFKKIKYSKRSLSLESIEQALETINPSQDALFTLPTSKDQFSSNNKIYNGHTEYLRGRYNAESLSMNFLSDQLNISLLTDHIPVKSIKKILTPELIAKRTIESIKGFTKYFYKPNKILFSGINPHAGEDGLLGNDKDLYNEAISIINKEKPHLNTIGPLSADTMLINGIDKNNLYIFAYHDQGLTLFKYLSKFLGVNVTFGLDFLRTSVDHGTAFELHGKNIANCSGCYYSIKKTIEALSYVD